MTDAVYQSYFSKYGRLPRFENERDLGKAFAFGRNKHRQPLVTRKQLEVLPGVYSHDPRFLRFLLTLRDRFNEAIPTAVDASTGYCTNGVHTDFGPLATVAGWMMNPMSAVMATNESYRVELGLEKGYDLAGRQIARNAWRIVWSHYKPSPLKVSQHSTGGAPRFTTSEEWKVDFANWIFEEGNFYRMLSLVKDRKWLDLANEFEMLWMLYMQKRDQVDSVGKPRFVFDREYAETSGESGWSGNADKTVQIQGLTADECAQLSATRARNVQAAIWTVNCVCSIVSTGTMQAMFERFPTLWHVNTADQIKEAIDGYEVYASDVKEYDRSMSEDALSVAFETAREFWSDDLITVAERLMFACYYSRPLSLDGERGFWVGELFGDGRQVIAGNRSGHNWTSLIAKVNKVIDELIALNRMGVPTLGNELKFMQNKGIVKLINNGDDNLTFGSKSIIDRYAEFRNDPKSGHYLISREVGCVYSGYVAMREKLDVPRYTPVGRLQTAMQKIYCPERAIGGHFRKYWYVGVQDRMQRAQEHPYGTLMWEIHNRTFHELMEPHFGSFMSMLIGASDRNPLDIPGERPADREAIDEPDTLLWKFKDGEVSDHVVNMLTKKIPYERIEKIVSQNYTGTLI